MSLEDTGDQVGGPRECQCGSEATDDHDDCSFQPVRLQGFIDRSLVEIRPRDRDVSSRGDSTVADTSAGVSVGVISSLKPVGAIIQCTVEEAEHVLRNCAALLR